MNFWKRLYCFFFGHESFSVPLNRDQSGRRRYQCYCHHCGKQYVVILNPLKGDK